MRGNQVFPSNFLRADDLQGRRITLTIAGLKLKDIGDDEGKPVLYFNGTDKGLVLNRTNWGTIADLYGDESDLWPGKQVVLYPARVQFKREMVWAIRVDPPQPVLPTTPPGFQSGLPDRNVQSTGLPAGGGDSGPALYSGPTPHTGYTETSPPPHPGMADDRIRPRNQDLDDEIPF